MSWGRGWEMRTSSGKMMFQRSLVSETSPATTWTSLALIQSRQHPFLLHHTHFHKQQGRANKLHPKLLENLQRQLRSSLRKAAGSSSSPRNPAWRTGTSSTNACFTDVRTQSWSGESPPQHRDLSDGHETWVLAQRTTGPRYPPAKTQRLKQSSSPNLSP